MATIRKLPSGRWNAIIRKKGLPTQTKTCDTKEEVEAWVSKIESSGKTSNKNTIASHIENYLTEVMEVAGKKRGGYRTARYLLNSLSLHKSLFTIMFLTIIRHRTAPALLVDEADHTGAVRGVKQYRVSYQPVGVLTGADIARFVSGGTVTKIKRGGVFQRKQESGKISRQRVRCVEPVRRPA